MISMPDRVRSVYRTEMTAVHGTDDDALRPQIRARSQFAAHTNAHQPSASTSSVGRKSASAYFPTRR